jgi:hypothetical protein
MIGGHGTNSCFLVSDVDVRRIQPIVGATKKVIYGRCRCVGRNGDWRSPIE